APAVRADNALDAHRAAFEVDLAAIAAAVVERARVELRAVHHRERAGRGEIDLAAEDGAGHRGDLARRRETEIDGRGNVDEAPDIDREHVRADVDRPRARERDVAGAEVEGAVRAAERDRAVERARRGAAAGRGVAELARGPTACGAGAPGAEQHGGGRDEEPEPSHQ